MFASGVKFSWYRNREKEFRKYYAQDDPNEFFTDIRNLLHQMGDKEYDPSTWRLFIDSSKRSLKAVLLHNSNVLPSISLAHSTKLSESYETLKLGWCLKKLNTTSMSVKYAVIWRSLDCCWDSKEGTQYFPVSYASGIAGSGTNIGILYIGSKGSKCN
jgi:hypothetical protein